MFRPADVLTIVCGYALLQACFATTGSQLSGKYCLDSEDLIEAKTEFSCLYLKPDGTATITMLNNLALSEARWEFLEQKRINLMPQSTGIGLTLDVSPDQSELIGLFGFVRFVRNDVSEPVNQPSSQAPNTSNKPPQTAPLIAAVGLLALVSLVGALVVLIRQKNEDDY
jgi:hypothetical protein